MPIFSVPESLRTWAEVDLGAIRANHDFVRQRIGPSPTILAVVKANGYGHGARETVRTLASPKTIFGVANLHEAAEIQTVSDGNDVMLLGPCLPGERREAVRANHIVTVSSAAEAEAFSRFGTVRINFKIDTGMGRIGCWSDAAISDLQSLHSVPGIEVHSISTHLPSADEDTAFTTKQLTSFTKLARTLHEIAPTAKLHSLNSAGILTLPEFAGDIVRPGLMLYGSSPIPIFSAALRPALAWKARIVLLKDLPAGAGVSYGRTYISSTPIRTAVIPVGYADGYPRQASGQGCGILIHGKKCDIIGRITMDQIVVNITDVPDIKLGDVVTLIGNDGNLSIDAQELADKSGTISWDILTGIGRRVERFYSEAP
jgi:alanine racemase